MENLTTFTNEVFGDIRGLEINNKPYFVARDVAKALGYKDPTNAIKQHCRWVMKHPISHPQSKTKTLEVNIIPEEDLYTLIQRSALSNIQKQELLGSLNLEEKFVLTSRKEIEFIDQLEETLKPFNIIGIRQYKILNYKIDFYISNLNIAIEYDENNHRGYTYEQQEGRQKEIENELGCRFIRVTDGNSHSFNVGQVIKEIFNI